MKRDQAARMAGLRKQMGLSQRELAKEFGVSNGTVSMWEGADRPIPGPILRLMEVYEQHLDPSRVPHLRDEILECANRWAGALVSVATGREAKRPTKEHLKAVLVDAIRRYLKTHLSSDPIRKRVQIATYDQLVRNIRRSRGIPLKLIQLASHLDPDLPPELRECLSKIQSSTVAMPPGIAARVIYEDFGQRPHELFAEWSPKPFATASIGQVHRARLKTGERVAVKIQYPEIQKRLETSFSDPVIAEVLALLIRAPNSDLLNEFHDRVIEECNYRREAENQARFGHFFKDDREIHIPRLFSQFCSRRVLTSEFIDGLRFDEFLSKATAEMKDQAASRVTRFQAETFFRHGFLYVDLHPGNFLFAGGKLVVLDFGRVVPCNGRIWNALGDLTAAILKNDRALSRKLIEKIGLVRDWSDFDFDELWQLLRDQHAHFAEDRPFHFDYAYVSRKKRLMQSFRGKSALSMPAPLFWNMYAVSSHDGIRAALNATANWRRIMLKAMS